MTAAEVNGQRVVCVLGSHRSGTSALTRCLQLLDVELGDDLMPGKPDNPRGFWENTRIVAINDAVLAACGRDLDSLLAPDLHAAGTGLSELRAEATAYIREAFGGSPLWGFKDPRTSRTLPFWLGVFEELRIAPSALVSVRNPCSVAKSMQRRQQRYGQAIVSDQFALELWFQYTIDALGASEGMARVIVDYDRLLADPGPELRRVAGALELPNPSTALDARARELLEEELNHHRPGPVTDPSLAPWVERLWGLCRQIAGGAVEDAGWRAALAELRAGNDDRVALLAEVDARRTEMAGLRAHFDEAATRPTRAEVDGLLDHLAGAERQISDLVAGMDDAQRTIHDLMAKRADMEREARFLDGRLAATHKLAESRQSELVQARLQTTDLAAFLGDSLAQSDERARLLAVERTRSAELTEALALSSSEVATARGRAEEAEQALGDYRVRDEAAAEATAEARASAVAGARHEVMSEYLAYRGLLRHRVADGVHSVLVPLLRWLRHRVGGGRQPRA